MATHRLHAARTRVEDLTGPEPILFDDCERCREHARDILSFDLDFTRALWTKMLMVERRGEGHYRSEAEAEACGRLRELMIWLDRWTNVDAGRLEVASATVPLHSRFRQPDPSNGVS
jgi:hypothetical protein